MPAIIVKNSIDSGHAPWQSGMTLTGEELFTVNGMAAAGTNDIQTVHTAPVPFLPHVPVIMGSSKLTVNGKQIAMVGDSLSCGAILIQGQPLMTIS